MPGATPVTALVAVVRRWARRPRDPRRLRDPRLIGAVVLLTALMAIALFAPRPDTAQIREWAGAAGSWFPLLFFVAHALATIA
ncbi:MAG: hypothetical protein J2P20_06130, partial [Pseudonocardia sp.]|nr:hypothetical protein [Pseudonocardia sp.]